MLLLTRKPGVPFLAGFEVIHVKGNLFGSEFKLVAFTGDGIHYWTGIKAETVEAARRLADQPHKCFTLFDRVRPFGFRLSG
jgi:hypothetical protein